jgi:hypothetical protein
LAANIQECVATRDSGVTDKIETRRKQMTASTQPATAAFSELVAYLRM